MSGKYALIIGNTEYIDPGLAQLTAPGKDTEDFARILKDKELCAFDEVKILLNQLSSSVIEAIDEFFDQRKPDDMLVLYFSGHGVRDEMGSLYLAVRNTIRSRLRSTAIRTDYIREAMDQSRSRRQILILDCCNSGAFPQGTKAELGGTMGMTRAFQGYGRFVLTASDATQFAWEGDKVIGQTENSLFTHFLVKGLEGDADNDGDGKITVDELYDYAYDQISRVTPKQTPTKSASKQEGEIVLRQITRIEDIKPVSLPEELIEATEDSRTFVREGAVQQLEKLLKGKNLGLARSAREVLERMEREDDSRRVSQAATYVLDPIRQAEQKAEEERRAREKAERLAAEKAKEGSLAQEKAEAERRAKEEAETLLRAQAERESAEREAARLKAEREAAELAARQVAENAARERAEKEAVERETAQKAEREAIELARRKKKEREVAERAERETIQLAARRKIEREAQEKATDTQRQEVTSQPVLRNQPILKWAIIGVIGLCVMATGAWGISSYLRGLDGAATPPTESPQSTATDAPRATDTNPPPTMTSTKPPPTRTKPPPTRTNTPPPIFPVNAATIRLQVVTGSDGTNDQPILELYGGSGKVFEFVMDTDPNALQPNQTDEYTFQVPAVFCEVAGYKLIKPAGISGDDAWDLREIYIYVDDILVFFDRAAGDFSPVTSTSFSPNGNWSGVADYIQRCGQ